MKTGLTKKQKVTEFYFNEHDDLAEIYTHNTDLKKHLLVYVKEHPERRAVPRKRGKVSGIKHNN